MYRNVLMMLAATVVAAIALFFMATLSYGWAYGESTFGGHLGFMLPILLGCVLALCGVVFGRADAATEDASERFCDLQEAYDEGRNDARLERIRVAKERASVNGAGPYSLNTHVEHQHV